MNVVYMSALASFNLCIWNLLHVINSHEAFESMRRPLPRFATKCSAARMTLRIGDQWLQRHPLTRADLDEEAEEIADAGLSLVVR